MATKKTAKERQKRIHVEVVKQMLTLATTGFGLVAALAWNSLIQELVNSYLKEWLPGSGFLSLLIYAVVVTALAVFVTLQLSRLLKSLEE
jgi:sorbitol-specific phosphotransferase system component IIBC